MSWEWDAGNGCAHKCAIGSKTSSRISPAQALTVSYFLLTASAALAQSSFIPEGHNGWEVWGQFGAGSGATAGSINAGYSSNGLVDAVVSISRSSFQNPYHFDYVPDRRVIKGTSFSETFRVFLAKQGRDGCPLSLAVSGGCFVGSFSAPKSPTTQPMEVDNTYMRYGASLYRDFRLADAITIQPSVGILYWHGFAIMSERYYGTEGVNHSARSFIVSASVSVPMAKASTLCISPAFTAYGRQAIVSVDAGIVFLN